MESPPSPAPRVEAQNTARGAAVASATDVASEGDAVDAAISQAAQKSGIPAADAARLAVFLEAYAALGSQPALTANEPANEQAPGGSAAEVIPVSATEAETLPPSSPAAVRAPVSNASSPTASGARDQPSSVRPPVSVYGPDRTSGKRRESARPAPEATVELRGPAASSTRSGRPSDEVPAATPTELQPEGGPAGQRRTDSTDSAPERAADLAAGDPDGSKASWSCHVQSAMEQLRQELANTTMDDQRRARSQVCLGLLHLALEDPEKAVEAIHDLDEQQLEFWRQTVMGLGILLDSDELPRLRHRVESATDHLSKGVQALSSLGPLQLSRASFCTKINGFGDFVECSANSLQPGEPVLLYVEVENVTAEPVQADAAQGSLSRRNAQSAAAAPRYVTELHGRYEILDVNQRQIDSGTLPVSVDTCRNQRRDFFASYVLYLPKTIEPGAYTLDLTIEDKKGGKFGNAVVDFRIR